MPADPTRHGIDEVTHELILGGQRSGKSRCAEARAAAWLAAPGRSAVLLATALAGDAEMQARIERHRSDRAARVPKLACQEVPVDLAQAVSQFAAPDRLVVIDCLSLWLTHLLMPLEGAARGDAALAHEFDALTLALREAHGPVVLVSNEISLGIVPLSAPARRFVDELGRLHQRMAALCSRVTLMVAGLEVPIKGGPP